MAREKLEWLGDRIRDLEAKSQQLWLAENNQLRRCRFLRMYRCEARCNDQESISATEPAGMQACSRCLTKIEADREQRGVKKCRRDGQMSLMIRFLAS